MATTTPRPAPDQQLMVRLRRAEGQLRGVQRMLEEGSDCQKVLTQLAAIKAAVDQVGLHLISERFRTCMVNDEGGCEESFEDAVATFLRFASLAK
jgi:DNA-binding FrmR family transcriptional regulator